MRNICLITWYNSVNYGTCLQCYALAEFLRQNNFNVYIPNSNKYYYGIVHPIETIRYIIDKINNKLCKKNNNNNKYTDLFKERIRKNTEFSNEKIKVLNINSKKDYKDLIAKCEFFISGSDQIWNPKYVNPPSLLSMAGEDKIKIAYGSSIGVSVIPKKNQKLYKKYIKRFNYIGLREKTAQQVIKDICNRESEVVLDPSFLLDKDEWKKIARKPKNIEEKEDFVFGYFIGNNKRIENEIHIFSKENKIPVYYAMSESKVEYSFGTAIADMGVQEFIWCLLNCKYIITDSFHAVALAINFNKNFYVYKRFKDSDNDSQNSRIYDIINTFNLEKNIESENNTLNNIKDRIDLKELNKKLDNIKKESISFLLKALGD